MKLLLDTNIILESLLSQEKADEAEALFLKNQEHDLYLSDFALHSIGATLFRKKKYADFCEFIEDIVGGTGIQILSLPEKELEEVSEVSQKYGLDFDDAYQYAVAQKHDLTLVSFDKDFDETERGRKTPAQILQDNLKPPADSGKEKEPGSGTPLAEQSPPKADQPLAEKDQSKEKK